jgi:hypothetical protein
MRRIIVLLAAVATCAGILASSGPAIGGPLTSRDASLVKAGGPGVSSNPQAYARALK